MCRWWSPTGSAAASAFLVRRMGVSVEHAALVNLLAGRLVVPDSSRKIARRTASLPPRAKSSGRSRSAPSSGKASKKWSRRSALPPHRQVSGPPKSCSTSTTAASGLSRRAAGPAAGPGASCTFLRCSSMLSLIMVATRSASHPARPSTSGFCPVSTQSRNASISLAKAVLLLESHRSRWQSAATHRSSDRRAAGSRRSSLRPDRNSNIDCGQRHACAARSCS